MFKICYELHTWLVKFTDSNKQLKRQLKDEMELIEMPLLVNLQRNCANKSKMARKKDYKLQKRLVQFTEQIKS